MNRYFLFSVLTALLAVAPPSMAGIGGPITDYHQTYSDIVSTNIQVDKVVLRTTDGDRIQVPFIPTTLNLNDLLGATKGLKLNLSHLKVPKNTTQLEIVEIELHLKRSDNDVTFNDQSACRLHSHKGLMLFTRQPFTVLLNAEYLVKVKFDSLASLQLSGQVSKGSKLKCFLASQREEIVNIINSNDEF